jgi:hypothetical protein
MPADDFNIHALFAALDERRRARNLTWPAVAREINAPFKELSVRLISVSTLTGMLRRQMLEGDGALQMMRWLGRAPECFASGERDTSNQGELLPDVPAGKILRFDTQSVFLALDARRAARGMTWQQVASELGGGVQPGSLKRLALGGRTSFPAIARIARWLDCPVARLTHASTN